MLTERAGEGGTPRPPFAREQLRQPRWTTWRPYWRVASPASCARLPAGSTECLPEFRDDGPPLCASGLPVRRGPREDGTSPAVGSTAGRASGASRATLHQSWPLAPAWL